MREPGATYPALYRSRVQRRMRYPGLLRRNLSSSFAILSRGATFQSGSCRVKRDPGQRSRELNLRDRVREKVDKFLISHIDAGQRYTSTGSNSFILIKVF